jgi:hypothetical protein
MGSAPPNGVDGPISTITPDLPAQATALTRWRIVDNSFPYVRAAGLRTHATRLVTLRSDRDVPAWRTGDVPAVGTSKPARSGRGRGPSIRIITTVRGTDGEVPVTANMFELLEAEWMRMAGDRAAAERLDGVCREAGGAQTLGELQRYVREADPAEADRVLLALVARAVEGDALAARVLLQLLLPGTRSLARRWWALGDQHERAAAAVLAVFHRIRTYPLARRPGRVAANILMDAARELRRSVPRVAQVPCPDPLVLRPPGPRGEDRLGPDPAVELAELLHDAVRDGIVDAEDAKLIARSRIAGDRVADIAESRGLRPRTLWDRRQRAELALVAAHAGAEN